MFVDAIEEVGRFTRPLHTISRNYQENFIRPGAATLFFVNDNGVAVTCKHVIEPVLQRAGLNQHFENFKKEYYSLPVETRNDMLATLEIKYGYHQYREQPVTVQLKETFFNCFTDPSLSFKTILHPQYDLAILIFENFKEKSYQSHARFMADSSQLKQGKTLCRLGYPFPEFNNFKYNPQTDHIEWTAEGRTQTPRFPIEGMLTRLHRNPQEIFGIELSTPGLRGQSGGPLFDSNGLIAGMQSLTNHLHLGFDMKNYEYRNAGETINVTNQPFLHVGQCIHVDIIKKFLVEQHIEFFEA